jgi:hypothetical protein
MNQRARLQVIGAAVASAVALGVAGCGAGGQETTGSPDSGEPDLSALLVQNGEEPGWSTQGKVDEISGVPAFAKEMDLSQADRERLADAGFISFTVAFTGSDQGHGAGVSNLSLFETEDGAQAWLEYDLANLEKNFPMADFERFEVPGVPDSGGWAGTPPKSDPVANIEWVEGRCVMVLGNQSSGDLVEPLTAAVQAIHERVKGHCP